MMRTLIIIILLSLPQWCTAACQGLSQAQYNAEIAKIMNQPTDQVDIDNVNDVKATKWLIRKLILYRNSDLPLQIGGTVDLASRCFARDAWFNLTGRDISAESNHPGGVIHWFQGHGVEKYDNGDAFE